jgi:septal ring factor EnvC (AmiA/AmiB activator)
MKYERASEISKGVVPFAPVPQRPSSSDALDNAGQNVLTLLQQAADISEQNSQHALDIAHKLSVQLRAAEDRIKDLEAELFQCQSRADRAERWLHQISAEIKKRFFSGQGPTSSSA